MNPDEGNLRSSHREMSALHLKFAHSSLHELACQFVETRLHDTCVRQRLQPEAAQLPLKKGTFFVLENESRADPGFLLFLPGKPAVFMGTRSKGGKPPPAWTLRMRTDVSLGNTLFIATLDKILHTLRIEDVWVWKGKTVCTEETFSHRRTYLKEFVDSLWVPDARLMGGIQTTIANPKPLSHLLTLTPESPVFSIDLIPELPGRRRFTFSPGAPPPQAPQPLPTPTILQKRDVAPIQTTKRVFATAVRLDALPDVYDLLTRDGMPLCRAAVQQLALSQELRKYKGSEIPVVAEWKTEFGRYEILNIDSVAS
jgi:hypothetical protein